MPVTTDEDTMADKDQDDTVDDVTDDTDAVEAETDEVEDTAPKDDTDSDATEAEAQVKDEAGDVQKAAPRWRGRALIAALVLVFLALAGTSGFLGWKQWEAAQVARASSQAESAAVRYAEILTSIDSNNVDENFRQVLDGATGEFKDMYSQSSVELRQLLIDNKATAKGMVTESAVQSASKDKVVVLLFVDQSVSNMKLPDPRIDRSRIKMTMQKVDGAWRASKVEIR